ncbi:hypothetical protein EJ08DRAFT_683158 [Tothia fuscella]|uniref:Knr4/Smi1-like domain-containing protein n=1 Tax=Tothia fuscella TaxID=1048955 RepID=A0A9P4NGX3_9PEZI|nr:hypothetical protein EJ08DRAFT_683158 [Tothia fuscella]
MVLAMEPERVLSDRGFDYLWYNLTEYAAELALLGEVDLSRKLTTLLFTNVPIRPYSLTFEGLTFAWVETQKWPRGLPDEAQSDAALKNLRKRNICNVPERLKTEEESLAFSQDMLEKCLSAIQEKEQPTKARPYRTTMDGLMPVIRALEISLRNYETNKLAQKTGNTNVEVETELNTAKTIGEGRARLKVTDLDPTSADLVRSLATPWGNQTMHYLSEAENLWPYILRGLFADALGVSHEELHSKGQAIVSAFSERLKNGCKPSTLEGKDIREILHIGNDNTISGPGMVYWEETGYDIPITLFQKPATAEELSNLEERLDIKLPDDYRGFLSISNGFGSFNGDQDGIYNGLCPEPELYSTDKVHWISESYFHLPVELLDLPYDIQGLANDGDKEADLESYFPYFERVLQIGTRDIHHLWLVPPILVEECKAAYRRMYEKANDTQKVIIERAMEEVAGSKEEFESMQWGVMMWASGGTASLQGHAGFRNYLQHVVDDGMQSRR